MEEQKFHCSECQQVFEFQKTIGVVLTYMIKERVSEEKHEEYVWFCSVDCMKKYSGKILNKDIPKQTGKECILCMQYSSYPKKRNAKGD